MELFPLEPASARFRHTICVEVPAARAHAGVAGACHSRGLVGELYVRHHHAGGRPGLLGPYAHARTHALQRAADVHASGRPGSEERHSAAVDGSG